VRECFEFIDDLLVQSFAFPRITVRALNGVKQAGAQPHVHDTRNTPEEARAKMKEIMDNPDYFSSDPALRFKQAEMRQKIPDLIRESNP